MKLSFLETMIILIFGLKSKLSLN